MNIFEALNILDLKHDCTQETLGRRYIALEQDRALTSEHRHAYGLLQPLIRDGESLFLRISDVASLNDALKNLGVDEYPTLIKKIKKRLPQIIQTKGDLLRVHANLDPEQLTKSVNLLRRAHRRYDEFVDEHINPKKATAGGVFWRYARYGKPPKREALVARFAGNYAKAINGSIDSLSGLGNIVSTLRRGLVVNQLGNQMIQDIELPKRATHRFTSALMSDDNDEILAAYQEVLNSTYDPKVSLFYKNMMYAGTALSLLTASFVCVSSLPEYTATIAVTATALLSSVLFSAYKAQPKTASPEDQLSRLASRCSLLDKEIRNKLITALNLDVIQMGEEAGDAVSINMALKTYNQVFLAGITGEWEVVKEQDDGIEDGYAVVELDDNEVDTTDTDDLSSGDGSTNSPNGGAGAGHGGSGPNFF